MQKFVIKINYLYSFFIKNIIKKFTDKLLNKYKNSNCISNLFYYSCSVTQTSPAVFDPMNCSTPGFPVLHHLPELTQAHIHWVGDAIQPFCPLSSPSIFPSIRVFSNESAVHIRWPNYWSFSFSISPSNE